MKTFSREFMKTSLFRTNRPIGEKEELIKEVLEMRKKSYQPDAKIGLLFLDTERINRLFQPYFKILGVDVKVVKAWFHFMIKGGERTTPHTHGNQTALYYLQIPENSAEMFFEKTGETIKPIEDDFFIFDGNMKHGITEHQSDKIRLAIAADLS